MKTLHELIVKLGLQDSAISECEVDLLAKCFISAYRAKLSSYRPVNRHTDVVQRGNRQLVAFIKALKDNSQRKSSNLDIAKRLLIARHIRQFEAWGLEMDLRFGKKVYEVEGSTPFHSEQNVQSCVSQEIEDDQIPIDKQ